MDHRVGIFRKGSDLLSAKEKIRGLKQGLRKVAIQQKGLAFNNEWIQFLELEGMLHVAETIVEGALARQVSRGSHFRTDYSRRNDDYWLRHTLAYKTPEGVRLDYKEVTITNYPPKERTY